MSIDGMYDLCRVHVYTCMSHLEEIVEWLVPRADVHLQILYYILFKRDLFV